jgi:putative endonuclease
MGWFSQKKGAEKEQLVTKWLKKQQIEILDNNFRCQGGEIDIIGKSINNTLIFFEVKYRKNSHHGNAAEYISTNKQKRITHCAKYYLINNPQLQNHNMRFDALILHGEQQEPDWIKDVFWLE